jgi:tellurite resistance protein TerC
VLCFIGLKMQLLPWLHIPVYVSLAVVAALIAGSVIASLYATRKTRH